MAINTRNRINPKSLSVQIKDAELQIKSRKRKIGVDTTALVRKMKQQITAPTTFLTVGGIGFLFGEITKSEPSTARGITDKPRTVETSPLGVALNLVTSIQTLYTTMPLLAWVINIFSQRATSGLAPEQPVHPTMADSGAPASGN
jgi:hypothetical protein